jgi:hypothetical protein
VRCGPLPSQSKILGGFLEPHVGRLRRSETETWLTLHLQWVTVLLDRTVSASGRRLKGKISEFINIGPARAAAVEEAEEKSGRRRSYVEAAQTCIEFKAPPSPPLSQSQVSSPTSDRFLAVHVGLIQHGLRHAIPAMCLGTGCAAQRSPSTRCGATVCKCGGGHHRRLRGTHLPNRRTPSHMGTRSNSRKIVGAQP